MTTFTPPPESGTTEPADALTHDPCCSSHGVAMTCAKYRRTHFVEVGRCCEHWPESTEPDCDGLCVYASEVLPGAVGVAYPHPGCPLHAPDETCGCGQPDRCLSPTHGQISMAEALTIRHRQAARSRS